MARDDKMRAWLAGRASDGQLQMQQLRAMGI